MSAAKKRRKSAKRKKTVASTKTRIDKTKSEAKSEPEAEAMTEAEAEAMTQFEAMTKVMTEAVTEAMSEPVNDVEAMARWSFVRPSKITFSTLLKHVSLVVGAWGLTAVRDPGVIFTNPVPLFAPDVVTAEITFVFQKTAILLEQMHRLDYLERLLADSEKEVGHRLPECRLSARGIPYGGPPIPSGDEAGVLFRQANIIMRYVQHLREVYPNQALSTHKRSDPAPEELQKGSNDFTIQELLKLDMFTISETTLRRVLTEGKVPKKNQNGKYRGGYWYEKDLVIKAYAEFRRKHNADVRANHLKLG